MTVPPESAAGALSRSERSGKKELLRKLLLERIGRTRTAPTSFAQERLWFIDRLEPGSAVYNLHTTLRLGGALDEAALERALGEIVRRHESLRTVFAEVDDSPVQVVAPFDGFALAVEDLSGLGEADREAAVRRRAGEEAARPFDLSAGPLFRAALLRLGEEDHVLLLSMHHVVSDGWSMGVLFREFSVLYAAYREGRESPLPELAVQYADYAVWQREQLEGEVLDRQLSYWRERLAGAPELLELPTDHPRPPVQTYRGATVPVEFSLKLLERLQALGRSEGATLYMTLLGAFQVLLGKYAGSEDVVVGSPIAGRTRAEVEELIGLFVNTLVLRTDLSGDPGFREVLRRVREVTLGAYAHQELPFEKLVAELQPERSLSHSPLFQVMFTLQNAGGQGGALPGLQVGGVDADLEIAKFDLSLDLAATPQGLRGGLNYSTDLFERGTIERMLGHLERVLEQVAADADVRLSQLELLADAERAQVLETWNRTEAEYPADRCIHELFEAQAERTPDAVAVSFEAESLTYAALNARANRLAHHLRGLGVGPDARVGICVERGPEMVAGLLGILKAGGAYVPLDPAYPADRLRYMLEDSAPAALVTQSSLAGTFAGLDVPVVELDAAAWTQGPETNLASAGLTPEHLAYVIYTSGSTGRPKGVMVQHRSLVNHTAWQAEAFGIGAGDTVLQRTSISFDASVWEVWTPLATGARMLLLSSDAMKDPEAIGRVMAEAGVTVAQFVPLLLQAVLGARSADRPLPCRTLFCGGEPLSAALVKEACSAGVGEVVNLYGPTEATIDSTWHPCAAGDGRAPAIGRPIASARIYVLHARGEPAPVGVAGELYVGGAGVARGYLGRAGLTAERFVPDPFSPGAGARLYRTGDLGRWRADGTLEFLGRTDFQVKIRGFRIELGEIEAALLEHEGVRESAVLAREDAGEKRVVAYVVGGVEADELREHLRRSLPEYMVPAAFVVLEALPLTPNGKLDRKALPAPEYAAEADRYVAPRTPVEEVLAGIWAEVLKVERVGVHDNFFALGGHSLLAVTLVERMRRRGVHADVRALFLTPTVAELAAAVEGTGSDVQVPPNRIPAGCEAITPEMLPLVELSQSEIDRIVAGVPGGAENVQDIYPLAPLQEGILFHHLLTPESDPYLLPQPFAFDSREQLEAYLAALRAAVARHDILRTSVAWEGLSEPVQVVWRHAPLLVEEVEVDPAAGDAARHLYERIDPLHYRIDLNRAPLLRAYVGRQAVGGRWGLVLLLHHLVSDHTTADVLREELEAHLDGRAEQLPAPLPFRNYVAQARLGVSRAEHEAFFRELLGDVDEPTAPFGLREVRGDGLGLEQGTLLVEKELGLRLRERARRLRVSVASVCHVAWAQVLARASGRSDVVFGTLLFGRMQGGEGADRVLGPFINTLPVRIRVGEESAEASVRRTQALLASLVRHEHASLALAQQYSGVPAPEPLFSALFNYRHVERGGGGGGGKSSTRGPRQAMHVMERSNYPLNLSVNDWGEGFSLSVQAEAEVGAERVCALMHTALAGLVQALEEAPERPLGNIEVLPEAERRQVLEAWNRTAAEVPADRCIHELFEAQAACTPDAVAVVFDDDSLTYRELNARANRLAHHLRGRGVGPEVRVGVLVERSPALIAAVLGVLKAGGAYVPLDPTYPAERLRYVLEDSGARVLVTGGGVGAEEVDGFAVVDLDAEAEAIAGEPETPPTSGVRPQNLAYVIHTSGSTGRPKGTGVPHRSLVSSTRARTAWYGADPARFLLLSSIAFDSSVAGVFWTLCGGGALHLMRGPAQTEPAEVVRRMGERGITDLLCVPSYYAALLRFVKEPLPSLARAIVAGEAATWDLAAQHGALLPHTELVNEYGPTEATVWSTAYRCPPDAAAAGAAVIPIGGPIPNARAYVVDGHGRPVPIGVAGELWVGGAGVTRGYLGRPGLTAERFVPDPFSGEAGARLYRTGDRVRWRADGAIEFLGRLDHQVKVRGFRIELGEIEAVLRRHESVTDCVVVARAETGESRLVAYIVGEAEAEALRAHVRRSLPEHMLPSAFVFLDALPLTPNGKLDRKALPAPELASAEDRYVGPRTPVEEVLAGIWAEVLRLERVGVEESFFDLGGHSLLATRVVSRIRDVFAIELPLRALFEGPTVAELAGCVEEMRRADLPVLPPLVPVERTVALPLSFAQERLWFLDRLEPGSATYNILAALRPTGALDERALERSLSEIVRRHEALRTVFTEVDGSPVQVVAPFGGFALPVEDLSGWSEAAVRRRTEEEARRGFDLSAGPLFRPALLRLGAEDHVLLLVMHHIVSDGWSMGVLFRELSALYAAYHEGGESPLPELAVQYADYAVWQREQLAGEVLDRQLAYWKERLAGAPELLELPTDHPRPPVQTFRGAHERIELPLELLERLQRLGRSEGATLYMVMLSAFQVLLSKYAGSEDVVVGSPIAGRTRKEIEELIGFFVNTLVLRTDLSGDPGFREVLRRTREVTLGAYEHQEVPFEKLVAELQPERSLSHSPLFQVAFSLQDRNQPAGGLTGLQGGGMEAELGITKFDLELDFAVHARGLGGGLSYSTDLFERSTIVRMLSHLERVLEQVAADADVRLSQLELLAAEEREQVLDAWNHTEREYSDPPAHALFAEWARRAPEATALLDGREAVTYGALDRRAAILARRLRDLGVGLETPVGLCMERTPELLVGVLGIWKAGGAYVPLDPGYPAERLGWIIADAALPVVVATGSTAGVLPEHGATLVRVDQLPETAAEAAPEVPASDAGLAYVIYTSGSTGRPKGVLVQHGSLSNLLAATREAFGIGEGDVMPALASYAFDIWLFEALLPLTSGGAVRLVERERVLDVPALVEEIADATLVHAVPALMRQVVQAERETPRLARLRRAFVGGDRVPADLLAEMRETLPGGETHVLYGPTEGTILASTHPVPADGVVHGHPIGRPLGNVRLYVCDAFGSPQPAGVPGELLIGGAGVTRGYLGRSAMTAERFVPDPFSVEGGARLYRTGDRARWRADGAIEYLGRLDFQVKVRGFRIELGEIEAVLRQHESVADCVVMARAEAGETRLVAYVVGSVEADELREHLRRSLPEYMVPAAFVVLEALPLTPNGKLDRKALPVPEYGAEADRYVAPRTPVEEVMAGIWAEVLKVERVGVHDNFFALGGHSLLAVTLVERMRRRGVRADVRALFTTPTVAELAAAAGGDFHEVPVPPNRIPAGCGAITPEMLPLVELTQGEIDRIVAGVPGGAANVQDIYPLAPLQEGILFHHLLTPESDPYLLPQAFAFESREQLEAYLAALRAAVARHDILRTSVVWEGLSEPVQVVWRHAPLSIEEVEVDPVVGDAARELYERVDPLHQRVDPSRAPLLRAYVGREAVAGRWGLLLLHHHLVSDHTTADVLREEMEAHLDGRADKLPAPLPFRNYVAQARLGVSRAEHEAFFRELLGDVDEPTAPFGLREVRGDGLGLEQGTLWVEEELGVRLRARARRLGVSPASVCHVAWAQVLARVSGRSDVVFGTVLFGRMEGGEGADRVLGPFINTLPVRIRVAEEGAEASVRRTQALLASLVRHEHASLALAQQMSGVPAPEPLFSALFNYRHAEGAGGGGGGNSSARGPRQAMHVMERSNYPLTLSVNDLGERFTLSVQAEAEVGAERVCALMHTALAGLVEALEEAPERPLESIEVLPEAERRQVLEAWNRPAAEVPADRCIHALFEAQVARTPEAVAVTFGAESVTYAELDARANGLARHLLERGARPDSLVGLLVERSVETVVAVLGILKAGAGYLPLDPADPDDRLAWVLEDSGAPIVVTSSALAPRLAGGGVEIVRLDSDAAESPEAPAVDVAPGSLAYVIYTSGSTGRPKGVQVTHANVVRLFAATDDWFGFGAQDVWTLFHSYAFDFSVWEIWGALLYGGRLVVVPFQVSRSPEEFYALLEAERVTVLNQTPSAFRQLMRADEEAAERGEPRELALRYVVFGGEALDPAILRGWVDRRGDDRPLLVNMYGITETTVHVTYRVVREADVRGGSSSPIGVPIPDLSVHLLDRNGQLVLTGMVGEMYIGGGGVARGYLHRPELTAERFVRDPFSADPAARLYRSGDLARRRVDGSLEFMGRADDQVKVRGFRIELREIESVLRGHPAVRETVVLTRGEGEEKRLVAWIVAAGEVAAAELRAHLLAHLPGHMVPSAFVRLDALPLTRNGKVDRRALPEPDADDLAGTDFVAPGTPTEEVLAALWAQLLGAERVGATDDFFMLGGHSLLATRLASRVRSDLRVELPIRAVFEHSTLGALAAEVDRLRRGAAGVEAPPIVPVPREGGDLPLSLAQERLWFADRMEPGSATYHMPLFVRLEGELDEDALRRALDELVRRHESLRTSFPLVDGFPVQRVAPPAPAEVTFHDLSALRDDERQDEAARLVREQARIPFWLETGPLFRADLVKLREGDHLLLATLHHAIADGWSLDLLWHELGALYGSFSRGEASPLPEPRIQYGDFSVWQRAWLHGEVLERQVAFWRRALDGAPPLLELPADRPRPAVQTHSGALEHAFLPREVADGVLALARREGATLFMVLLAALDLVLSRQSGEEDVVVGTPIAGRTRAETDRVVGLFLNSLALRVSLADDPAFRELLGRVRDTTLDAYAHQDAPFEAVLEEIQPERALDRTPVFQVMLNLANFAGAGEVTAADGPSGFAGLRVRGVDQGAGALAAKFDFTLYAGEGPEGIALTLVYNTDLFDAGRMAALLAQLAAVLKQAVEDPGLRLSRFVLADGRAPSGADRELRTAAGLPAGVGEPGAVWERHDGRWAATGERGRYLPDGSIAALSSTQAPEARTEPAAPAPDAGAALTETEREMLAIWHEVLGEPVELHDDFFDLGGHSLLGVRLLARVKKRLGRTLALPVLFGAPTPAALSAKVDDTGEGRGFVHLVPMGGEQGALPPLFLVHPAGGTVFKYADLARHLGDERPIYAIQAAGVTDGAEPLRTVDLMAQAYLEEVLRLQPQGPYYLAGWSAGGVIVMEMAHRLRAAGHEVALAALLDSSPPNAEKPVPDPVPLYRRLAAGLSSAEPAELDALEDEMRGLAIDDRLPHLARWLAVHGAESRVHELDGLKPVVEVFRAIVAATRRHPLAPYPGRVTLFCAEMARGEGWEKADLPGLWKPFVSGELEVVVVPGTHITMVSEPNVRDVAAAIGAAMARC